MIAKVGLDLCIALFAKDDYQRTHCRKDSNGQKRIAYLSQDVFILRKFLLDLVFKKRLFLPYIKEQKNRYRKTQIANRVLSEAVSEFHQYIL